MSEIKNWAFSICIILITTGIFMRVLPERSDKKTVKFVAVLILIISVFKIDISSLSDLFDFDISDENSTAVSEYEDYLVSSVNDTIISQIEEKIASEYQKIDGTFSVTVNITDETISAYISGGRHLNYSEKENLHSKIISDFKADIEFVYE